MAKKYGTRTPKRGKDTEFNPFQECVKILVFSREAGGFGLETFTVFVEDGNLEWTNKTLPKKHPGFIAVIDRTKLDAGLTNNQWRRLEEKIAKEMHEQRKAW